MPKFIKLSETEKKELSNTWDLNNLSKIKISDPACKYYDMKKNDVFKIIRPSNNSYEYITYRIVI
jgi:DNA-directed RNA polymerase subunit H (RpoH/RPB5)